MSTWRSITSDRVQSYNKRLSEIAENISFWSAELWVTRPRRSAVKMMGNILTPAKKVFTGFVIYHCVFYDKNPL